MNLIDLGNPTTFLLVLLRVAGIVAVAPILGHRALPLAVRGGLAILLALVFAPLATPVSSNAIGTLIAAGAAELATGLLIGFAASLIFYAVRMAGRLMDQDMQFALSGETDPGDDEPASPVARLQLTLAGLAYLLINGPQLLVSAMLESFRAVPLGGAAMPATVTASSVAGLATHVCVVAIQLAAPAFLTLLLVTIALGFLARTVPEMNLVLIGYPIRLLVGLVVLALGVGFFVHAFARAQVGSGSILKLIGGSP